MAEIAPSFPYKGVFNKAFISAKFFISEPTTIDLRNFAADTIPSTNSPVIVGAEEASPHPISPLSPDIFIMRLSAVSRITPAIFILDFKGIDTEKISTF